MTSQRNEVGIHIRHDDWLDMVNKMVHAVAMCLSEINEDMKIFPRNLLH